MDKVDFFKLTERLSMLFREKYLRSMNISPNRVFNYTLMLLLYAKILWLSLLILIT